jgi:hypothetical protein
VVAVNAGRVAIAASGWLLTVTVVSCLAWAAIMSAGHRVGLATDVVQSVAGPWTRGADDAALPATGRSRSGDVAAMTTAAGAAARVTPSPVTGRSGTGQAGSPRRDPGPATNGTGAGDPADSRALQVVPPQDGSFLAAPAGAGGATTSPPSAPTARPTDNPGSALPIVTSSSRRVASGQACGGRRTVLSTPSGTNAADHAANGMPGPVSGTFVAAGGQILLTCSVSGMDDWRVLATIGWAAGDRPQPPDVLLVTFTQGTRQLAVRAGCAAGDPVFTPAGGDPGAVPTGAPVAGTPISTPAPAAPTGS